MSTKSIKVLLPRRPSLPQGDLRLALELDLQLEMDSALRAVYECPEKEPSEDDLSLSDKLAPEDTASLSWDSLCDPKQIVPKEDQLRDLQKQLDLIVEKVEAALNGCKQLQIECLTLNTEHLNLVDMTEQKEGIIAAIEQETKTSDAESLENPDSRYDRIILEAMVKLAQKLRAMDMLSIHFSKQMDNWVELLAGSANAIEIEDLPSDEEGENGNEEEDKLQNGEAADAETVSCGTLPALAKETEPLRLEPPTKLSASEKGGADASVDVNMSQTESVESDFDSEEDESLVEMNLESTAGLTAESENTRSAEAPITNEERMGNEEDTVAVESARALDEENEAAEAIFNSKETPEITAVEVEMFEDSSDDLVENTCSSPNEVVKSAVEDETAIPEVEKIVMQTGQNIDASSEEEGPIPREELAQIQEPDSETEQLSFNPSSESLIAPEKEFSVASMDATQPESDESELRLGVSESEDNDEPLAAMNLDSFAGLLVRMASAIHAEPLPQYYQNGENLEEIAQQLNAGGDAGEVAESSQDEEAIDPLEEEMDLPARPLSNENVEQNKTPAHTEIAGQSAVEVNLFAEKLNSSIELAKAGMEMSDDNSEGDSDDLSENSDYLPVEHKAEELAAENDSETSDPTSPSRGIKIAENIILQTVSNVGTSAEMEPISQEITPAQTQETAAAAEAKLLSPGPPLAQEPAPDTEQLGCNFSSDLPTASEKEEADAFTRVAVTESDESLHLHLSDSDDDEFLAELSSENVAGLVMSENAGTAEPYTEQEEAFEGMAQFSGEEDAGEVAHEAEEDDEFQVEDVPENEGAKEASSHDEAMESVGEMGTSVEKLNGSIEFDKTAALFHGPELSNINYTEDGVSEVSNSLPEERHVTGADEAIESEIEPKTALDAGLLTEKQQEVKLIQEQVESQIVQPESAEKVDFEVNDEGLELPITIHLIMPPEYTAAQDADISTIQEVYQEVGTMQDQPKNKEAQPEYAEENIAANESCVLPHSQTLPDDQNSAQEATISAAQQDGVQKDLENSAADISTDNLELLDIDFDRELSAVDVENAEILFNELIGTQNVFDEQVDSFAKSQSTAGESHVECLEKNRDATQEEPTVDPPKLIISEPPEMQFDEKNTDEKVTDNSQTALLTLEACLQECISNVAKEEEQQRTINLIANCEQQNSEEKPLEQTEVAGNDSVVGARLSKSMGQASIPSLFEMAGGQQSGLRTQLYFNPAGPFGMNFEFRSESNYMQDVESNEGKNEDPTTFQEPLANVEMECETKIASPNTEKAAEEENDVPLPAEDEAERQWFNCSEPEVAGKVIEPASTQKGSAEEDGVNFSVVLPQETISESKMQNAENPEIQNSDVGAGSATVNLEPTLQLEEELSEPSVNTAAEEMIVAGEDAKQPLIDGGDDPKLMLEEVADYTETPATNSDVIIASEKVDDSAVQGEILNSPQSHTETSGDEIDSEGADDAVSEILEPTVSVENNEVDGSLAGETEASPFAMEDVIIDQQTSEEVETSNAEVVNTESSAPVDMMEMNSEDVRGRPSRSSRHDGSVPSDMLSRPRSRSSHLKDNLEFFGATSDCNEKTDCPVVESADPLAMNEDQPTSSLVEDDGTLNAVGCEQAEEISHDGKGPEEAENAPNEVAVDVLESVMPAPEIILESRQVSQPPAVPLRRSSRSSSNKFVGFYCETSEIFRPTEKSDKETTAGNVVETEPLANEKQLPSEPAENIDDCEQEADQTAGPSQAEGPESDENVWFNSPPVTGSRNCDPVRKTPSSPLTWPNQPERDLEVIQPESSSAIDDQLPEEGLGDGVAADCEQEDEEAAGQFILQEEVPEEMAEAEIENDSPPARRTRSLSRAREAPLPLRRSSRARSKSRHFKYSVDFEPTESPSPPYTGRESRAPRKKSSRRKTSTPKKTLAKKDSPRKVTARSEEVVIAEPEDVVDQEFVMADPLDETLDCSAIGNLEKEAKEPPPKPRVERRGRSRVRKVSAKNSSRRPASRSKSRPRFRRAPEKEPEDETANVFEARSSRSRSKRPRRASEKVESAMEAPEDEIAFAENVVDEPNNAVEQDVEAEKVAEVQKKLPDIKDKRASEGEEDGTASQGKKETLISPVEDQSSKEENERAKRSMKTPDTDLGAPPTKMRKIQLNGTDHEERENVSDGELQEHQPLPSNDADMVPAEEIQTPPSNSGFTSSPRGRKRKMSKSPLFSPKSLKRRRPTAATYGAAFPATLLGPCHVFSSTNGGDLPAGGQPMMLYAVPYNPAINLGGAMTATPFTSAAAGSALPVVPFLDQRPQPSSSKLKKKKEQYIKPYWQIEDVDEQNDA